MADLATCPRTWLAVVQLPRTCLNTVEVRLTGRTVTQLMPGNAAAIHLPGLPDEVAAPL